MRRRLADEGGFTLVELLTAMTIGLIIIGTALAVMDGSWRLEARTTAAIDATNRGRLAMDRITGKLGERVCLRAASESLIGQGPFVTATDAQVEFFASVTSDSAPRLVAERRRLTYRPTTSDILYEAWTGTAPPPTEPPATAAPPTRSVVVATRVQPTPGTPVFRYYALDGTPALPTLQLATPIAGGVDRDRVVLVKVGYTAVGEKPGTGVDLLNDSLTRSPRCMF